MSHARKDDDIEFVPIPLDRETIALLSRLGAFLGEHPARLAGALLRDVVREDAMAHAGVPEELRKMN